MIDFLCTSVVVGVPRADCLFQHSDRAEMLPSAFLVARTVSVIPSSHICRDYLFHQADILHLKRFNLITWPNSGMMIGMWRFFASVANTCGGSNKGSSERSKVP